jgi:hypothetical protein
MKNLMIFRNLLFVSAIFFVFSCKKSDEVTPASLVGKWKDNGTVGKISGTDNGKPVSYDLGAAVSSTVVEFKSDGTVDLGGGIIIKYVLSGSILTFSGNGLSFDYTVSKVSATELVLSFTKDQYYKYVDVLGDPNDDDVKTIQRLKSTATVEYKENYVKQ